jgi:hypothetical protein
MNRRLGLLNGSYSSLLRHELRERNIAFGKTRNLAHVLSYGERPVVVYEAVPLQSRHGNFLDASYSAIMDHPDWKRRLEKAHPHARRSLPPSEREWKELDSSMSSDALLMNIFCHPQTLKPALFSLLGVDEPSPPVFGFKARVALRTGHTDRTEVDMKIASLLVEAKLTETDFQVQKLPVVESYRDLEAVFDRKRLPRTLEGSYVSYQLIRNVLAAYQTQMSFCVLQDERRPDLKDAWYEIMAAVMDTGLRTRCKVLTWQELSEVLSPDLREFLDLKYGIVAPGKSASRPWEEKEG